MTPKSRGFHEISTFSGYRFSHPFLDAFLVENGSKNGPKQLEHKPPPKRPFSGYQPFDAFRWIFVALLAPLRSPLSSFWRPFGSMLGPFGSILDPFGPTLVPFGSILHPLAFTLGRFRLHPWFWAPKSAKNIQKFTLDQSCCKFSLANYLS